MAQRKTKVVNCRVPAPLADACAAHGASAGESVAWGIRDLLRRGLATVNPEVQPNPAGPTRHGAPGPAKLRERFAATTAKAKRKGGK